MRGVCVRVRCLEDSRKQDACLVQQTWFIHSPAVSPSLWHRARDLAVTDRDLLRKEKAELETQVKELTRQVAEVRKTSTSESTKMGNEMVGMTGAITECENRYSALSVNFCSMCSHCTNVHFPACSRTCAAKG